MSAKHSRNESKGGGVNAPGAGANKPRVIINPNPSEPPSDHLPEPEKLQTVIISSGARKSKDHHGKITTEIYSSDESMLNNLSGEQSQRGFSPCFPISHFLSSFTSRM
ncbi:unnamed protein product [Allacma fusca]|uniref:Uncharacterized protein n=1 Tax=Allacma fusca TaxID=39272 RepID=A0A8J2KBB7_9HEXA|nr:unnamed protein product [Allacma fusca]